MSSASSTPQESTQMLKSYCGDVNYEDRIEPPLLAGRLYINRSTMSEPLVDPRPIAPAHSKFFAGYQHNSVLAVRLRAYLLHVLEVHDRRTMHAQKHLRV